MREWRERVDANVNVDRMGGSASYEEERGGCVCEHGRQTTKYSQRGAVGSAQWPSLLLSPCVCKCTHWCA